MARARGRWGRSAIAAALASAMLAPRAAQAQSDAAGARVAQSLFDEGRALLDAGRYEEACPKLAESQRLDPGGGTLLNLAVCYERLGRTATAWAKYNEAVSLAIADRRSEREAFARGRVAALAPHLPRLRVVLGTQSEVAIRIDGEAVPRAALDTGAPVDPGKHVVDASMPGHRAWSAVVTASIGETSEVAVPFLEPDPAIPVLPPPDAAPSSPPEGVSHAQPEARRSTAFWVVGGVAVAGAVTSVATGLVALSAHASANDKCDAARAFCADASGADDASRARTFAWVSTGALGVAVVGTVVAFLLPREESASVVRVGLAPMQGGAVVGIGGSLP